MLQQVVSNKNGQLFQSDFANNVGGINLTDSVFKIQDTQAAGGYNFDYTLMGGIRKRLGPVKINTVASSTVRSLGLGLYAPASGTTKSVIRATDSVLQYEDTSAPSFTTLSQDTASAGTTPFTSGSTQTVCFSMFNNGSSNILWCAGGGATLPVGAYSLSKFTQNGVASPTGSFSATLNTHNSGSWTAAGLYFYAIVYRKASTQAFSNAALDVSATTVNTDDTVTLNFTGLTGLDTTLMDKIYVYRSARSGVSGFTTGNLIATLASTATSFVDKGDLGNPDILSSQNIPRANNIVLDNSTLPAGTYNSVTLFKRRLVTAQNSTLYLSDLNKSESWPTTNVITLPSAGNITGLAAISFTSPQAQSLDEILVIFKEREMWVITGDDYTTWVLKFIDQVGCPDQSLVALANGFLAWIDFRGIYLWDGTSKPTYCSRLLEPLFARDGDLDKTKLALGTAEFFRRENQIIWYLSSKTYGEQKFSIKMDLRLTLPQIEQTLTGRNLDAVLITDTYQFPIYAAMSYIPTGGAQEQVILGDGSGFTYYASNGYDDGGTAFPFTYLSPPLCMGDPNTKKKFHKVVVWVTDLGNWNLELDYWTDYKAPTSANATSQSLPLTTENQTGAALWDVAFWDTAYWDSFSNNVVPLVFNLQSGSFNSTEGSAIQVQFKNANANQPIVIHGYSIMWSPQGGITA